jgi:hypothetical protein
MDPNATWLLLLEAIQTKDWKAVRDHAEDLLDWLDRSGFPPDTCSGIVRDHYWNKQMARHACKLAKAIARRQRGR